MYLTSRENSVEQARKQGVVLRHQLGHHGVARRPETVVCANRISEEDKSLQDTLKKHAHTRLRYVSMYACIKMCLPKLAHLGQII